MFFNARLAYSRGGERMKGQHSKGQLAAIDFMYYVVSFADITILGLGGFIF